MHLLYVFYVICLLEEATPISDFSPIPVVANRCKNYPLLDNYVEEARVEDQQKILNYLLNIRTRWIKIKDWFLRRAPDDGIMVAMTGFGGIGKTVLAFAIACQNPNLWRIYQKHEYIDMKGIQNATALAKITNEEVLRKVMQALEIETAATLKQWDKNQLIDHYRRFLTGKSHLIILDDPPDTTDLSFFMPPADNAVLVVTRPGPAADSLPVTVRHVKIEPLTREQADTILARYWQTGYNKQLSYRICKACGYVPIALVVAGKTIASLQRKKEGDIAHAPELFATSIEQERNKAPFLLSQFFDRFDPFSTGDAAKKRIEEVFRLSYNLLDDTAQHMFRSLAVFGGNPFDEAAARYVAFADHTADIMCLSDLVTRGLVRDLGIDSSQTIVYSMYDLLYEYARYELWQHQDKQDPLVFEKRYLDYYTHFVTTTQWALAAAVKANDAEEQERLIQRVVLCAPHIARCYATFTASATDPTSPINRLAITDSQILTFIAPVLPLLRAGQAAGIDQEENAPHIFAPTIYDEWQATCAQVMQQVYAQQSDTGKSIFHLLTLFEDWVEDTLIQRITNTASHDFEALVEAGLFQQQTIPRQPQKQEYQIWNLLRDFCSQYFKFDQLSPEHQATYRAQYATYYAEQVKKYRWEGTIPTRLALFDKDSAYIIRGQAFAATATPPLDELLVLYLEHCFWYFEQQANYDTLLAWTETTLDAAQRLQDEQLDSRLLVLLLSFFSRLKELGEEKIPPTTYDQWKGIGIQILNRVYTHQNDTGKNLFNLLTLFEDWVEGTRIQRITKTAPHDFELLVTAGLFQKRDHLEEHKIGRKVNQPIQEYQVWESLQDFVLQHFDQLAQEHQATYRAQYATYYAEQVKKYRWDGAISTRLALFDKARASIIRGQAFAATATPPLDELVLTYADECFWYFDRIREYVLLQNWTEQAFAAAQRLQDSKKTASMCLQLGIVAERQREWALAQQFYHQVYDGDLRDAAAPATRASACNGLGIVAERQREWALAQQFYHQVYDGDLRDAAAPDTRANACLGLGNVATDPEIEQQYYHQVYDGDLRDAADPATRASACYNLGVVATDPEIKQQYYHQVYDGDLRDAAAPATRASACYGLGNIATDPEIQQRYYHQVYDGDLRDAADPATRASACNGLGNVAYNKNDPAAIGYYQEAIALASKHAQQNLEMFKRNLDRAYKKFGNPPESEDSPAGTGV